MKGQTFLKKRAMRTSLYLTTFFMIVLGSTALSAAEKLKARICYNCSTSEAERIAKRFEPEIRCNTGDVFGPDYGCFSDPEKIIVANYSTRNIWAFKVHHRNQGASGENMMTLDVSTFPLSSALRTQMQSILSGYQALWEAIKDTNDDLAANTSPGFSSRKPGQSGDCSNDGQANAVRAIYDVINKAAIYDSLDERLNSFWTRRSNVFLNKATFSSEGISEALTFIPSTGRVIKSFPRSSRGMNQAVFSAKLVEGELVFSTDEHRSRINGLPLFEYASTGVNVRQKTVSGCAKEALDELLTPAGGGSGSGSDDGDGSSSGDFVFNSGGSDWCQRSYDNGSQTFIVAYRC